MASTATASHQAAVKAASTASQNSANVPEFTFPNLGCAAQCLGNIAGYSACYNNCVNSSSSGSASIVQTGGGGSVSTPTIIQGNKSPVVTPGTNSNTTSGAATTGSGTANQTYPSSAASSPTAALSNVNWSDIGIRAGLILGGGILVIIGVVKLFSGQPVTAPGMLARRRPAPTPPPVYQPRSFVETREVGNPPPNPTVRTRPNVTAAAAGAP
jgi:hypothetical protein